MKKITKILIAIVFSIVLFSGISVLAYYLVSDNGKQIEIKTNIENETIVSVSSFNDLIVEGTVDKYNDHNKTSLANKRVIIKLMSNITLEDNIVLTKDIHIDLNSKILNLNDKTLTFKHDYSGCFMLYNGIVDSGSNSNGAIVFDMPNSGIEFDTVTFKNNGTSTTEDDFVTILNLNEKYTIYSALYLVGSSISADIVGRPKFKTYSEVNAIETLTSNLFVLEKNCSYNSNTLEACSFVYQDIILPNHYLSSDISITYTSSNTNILTNDGKLGGTFGDCNLTATISKEGWSSVSVTFPLHVIDITNQAIKKQVAFAIMKDYLSEYYVEGDLIIKNNVVLEDYYYKFTHAIMLPKTIFGGNITYSYKTTDLSGNTNSNAVIYLENPNDNAYIFGPSLRDYHLVITVLGEDLSLNMYSTYVGLEETVAYHIVNYLYGGSIIFDRASTGKELVSLQTINAATSTDDLYDLKQYISSYNVTGITYTLSGDVNTHYEIVNGVLKIKEGVIPFDKESKVTIRITFGSTFFDIDLFVEYLDSNGSTLSSYLTYYSIYNALVPSELETSFEMPFATNNIAPYTVYDVATYQTERVGSGENSYTRVNETLFKPNNLKIALWYDGVEKLVFTNYGQTPVSFSNQLDQHLTTTGLTLQQIAAKTGSNRAYYKFSIDAQNSLNINTKLVIIYNYKFDQAEQNWSRYEHSNHDITDNNTTYLTVLGGLFYSTTGRNASNQLVDHAVRDGNFFVWIYNKFRPNLSNYSDITEATTTRIIPIDWLGQSTVITKEDTALSRVTDFSGIKYLTSVTEVNLSGGGVSTNVLNGISEMKSLQKLVLANCSLTNVNTLSRLAGQGTIKVLDVSNNNIQYFDGITTITSLEKVYLYNNNQNNKYYGSKGICNFQAFADLMRNGCAVYNDTSNNIPVLYAESNNLDDYKRLKEIAYTDKLKEGLDIRNLYSNFVLIGTNITNVTGNNRPGNNPFGLQTAGTLIWGYQGDDNEGAKYIKKNVTVGANITSNTYYELINGTYSYTTDTTFVEGKTYYVLATYSNAEYFYVKLRYTNGEYEMIVKYYVDRY